jgi:hypothetical protein
MERKTYNGWANRETWNVSLHLNNVQHHYEFACEFMANYKGRSPYQDFVDAYGMISTIDGVLFNDPKLSKRELNSMMRELI